MHTGVRAGAVVQVSDNPEFASQSGIHEYDHLLQDLSPAAFDRRLQHNLRIVGLAEQIEVDALGAEGALHLKVAAVYTCDQVNSCHQTVANV